MIPGCLVWIHMRSSWACLIRLCSCVRQNILLLMPVVPQWSLKGPRLSLDLTLRTILLHIYPVITHWPRGNTTALDCGGTWRRSAPSDGVRVHLHAPLAAKNARHVMEPHACRRYRVNSTINRGKHSLDTGAQGHVQPCLGCRHTGSSQELDDGFGFKCHSGNIGEVESWRLLSMFFLLCGVKCEFLHTCTERLCVALWGFGSNVQPDYVTVVDSGLQIDVWF